MATKKVDFVVKERGASKVKKGFQGVDKSMANAAKSAAKYAAGYLGARGIINLTKSVIEAFGVQEQAEKRLTIATGRNIDALKQQASALQQLTTSGDEMIIGVQASLAAFADSDEEIKRLTVSTLDLAAATGMDLKAAGDLIAKSYGSSTNALSRYGIEVTGVANSTERLDTLTSNIAARFAGQAAAAAETMAGKMQQAKNAVGDLAEVMGEALSDSVIDLAGVLKTATEGVIAFFDVFKTQKEEKRIKELKVEIVRLKELYDALGEATVDDGGARNALWDTLVAAVHEYKVLMGLILDDSELWENSVRRLGTAFEGIPLFDPQVLKETERNLVNFSSIVSASLGNAFDPDMGKGDAFKQFTIQFLSLLQGVILASEAVSTALSFTFAGPIGVAAAISSLAVLEGAKALVRNVEFAATGANFETSGPQLMLVGEAGREQVSVTPLEGPNINGPQGGVTVNLYGDIIGTDEYMENNLIPAINLAVQQGRAALA